MLRPDFDPEIHTAIKQSGFNVQIREKEEATAQNYEEIKMEEKEDESQAPTETSALQ